jgi:vancomycin resistance protein YoaR
LSRSRRSRSSFATIGIGGGLLLLVATLLGLAFAGSRSELPSGTRIASVDVGGMTHGAAVSKLERRFARVASRPVTFVAGGTTFRFSADQLGVVPNWRAAVGAAARESDGFGPVRGFRRLHTRVFGAEVFPPLAVSDDALEFALDEVARAVDRLPRSAALVRHGLKIELRRERTGERIDRGQAAHAIVHVLGSVQREDATVVLPVVAAQPAATTADLAVAARRARIALSGPVVLRGQSRTWRLPRWRIARLLELPRDGSTKIAFAGPAAGAYFRALGRRVDRAPVDASWDVSETPLRVTPARPGVELDAIETARRLLRAATSRTHRVTTLAVATVKPARSTAEAQELGIKEEMGTYKTSNAGTFDRITNLRLGVEALDGTLVPPGGTFSLNQAIGQRTAARGFRRAPVIIGTKYSEEIGGGTSQVATTVFNAAWEAGVRITERNPHALYISRYPLGRDATVYWPSLDLKFLNDTKHWILVRGFPESDGIRVSLYGGEKRRVESLPGTQEITGPTPVRRIKNRALAKGETIVQQYGEPPSKTSVTRTIYGADGKLIRTETWNTTYAAEPTIEQIGTKVASPKKAPKKKPPKKEPAPTTTSPTTSTQSTTTPTPPRRSPR